MGQADLESELQSDVEGARITFDAGEIVDASAHHGGPDAAELEGSQDRFGGRLSMESGG